MLDRKWGSLIWLCLSIFLAGLCLATSCSHTPPRPSGAWLVFGLEGNPRKLDPRFATDAYSSRIVELIYSSLVKLDDTGAPVGDLAENFETPDDVTYRFELRRGVKFHNGGDLTCEDVAFTFDLIRRPDSTSPFRADFSRIAEMSCSDDYNLEIKLDSPFAPFIVNMTMGILPKDVDPESQGDNPVGSGPFEFVEQVAGERLRLKRFDGYFGSKPRIDGVVFRVLPNNITRVLELESGGVDILQNSIAPEHIQRLRKDPRVVVRSQPGINYNYMGFNLDHPVLKNRDVREAIARSINTAEIIEYLWCGTARPATNLLNPEHWAFNPNVASYPYSPDAAKKLLDGAGFPDPDGDGPGKRFELVLKTSTDRLRRRICEVIKTQLQQVGIGVKVQSFEFGTFYRDVKSGNFELYTLAWVGITEPDIYWAVFNSNNIPPDGTSMNRNRYRNSEVDRLTEAARSTSNMEKRRELYFRVQEISGHDLPYASLYYTDDVAAYRDYVKDWKIGRGGSLTGLVTVRLER